MDVLGNSLALLDWPELVIIVQKGKLQAPFL